MLSVAPFPTDKLSGEAKEVSLDELKTVLDYQHLVRCMEYICQNTYAKQPLGQPLVKDPISGERWSEIFHRSMYKNFLAGALLYEARSTFKSPFLELVPFKNQEPTFGPPAEFLAEESKKRVLPSSESAPEADSESTTGLDKIYPDRLAKPKLLDSAQAEVLYNDALGLMWTSERLTRRTNLPRLLVNGDRRRVPAWRNCPRRPICPNTRKVQVILFGIFVLEEISMPRYVRDATVTFIQANIAHIPKHLDDAFQRNSRLLRDTYELNTEIDRSFSYGSAPPPILFVQFVLRKYLGVRIPDMFMIGWWLDLTRFGYDGQDFCSHRFEWIEADKE